MASKRFKGKPCSYCESNVATTGDHVIPRALVVVARRADLPKVPSCADCNARKSAWETQLTAVLPFGARHMWSQETLAAAAPRLERNLALQQIIEEGYRSHVDESGEVHGTIPVDTDVLLEYARMLIQGLSVHLFTERIVEADRVYVELLHPEVDDQMVQRVLSMAGDYRNGDFADGTLTFEVLRSAALPFFAVWRFAFLGGAQMAGEGPAIASAFWAVTGEPDVVRRVRGMG